MMGRHITSQNQLPRQKKMREAAVQGAKRCCHCIFLQHLPEQYKNKNKILRSVDEAADSTTTAHQNFNTTKRQILNNPSKHKSQMWNDRGN